MIVKCLNIQSNCWKTSPLVTNFCGLKYKTIVTLWSRWKKLLSDAVFCPSLNNSGSKIKLLISLPTVLWQGHKKCFHLQKCIYLLYVEPPGCWHACWVVFSVLTKKWILQVFFLKKIPAILINVHCCYGSTSESGTRADLFQLCFCHIAK